MKTGKENGQKDVFLDRWLKEITKNFIQPPTTCKQSDFAKMMKGIEMQPNSPVRLASIINKD